MHVSKAVTTYFDSKFYTSIAVPSPSFLCSSFAEPDGVGAGQASRPVYPGPMESDAWTAMLLVYSLVLGPVCPLAPLVCFVWMLVRVLTQTHQLLYVYQRPHPYCAAPRGGFWPQMPLVVLVVAAAVHVPMVCSGLDDALVSMIANSPLAPSPIVGRRAVQRCRNFGRN